VPNGKHSPPAPLSSTIQIAGKFKAVRIAFETVIWGRRLDDVEFVLDTIAAFGYQGVEFAQSPEEIFVRDRVSPEGRRPVKDVTELLSLLEVRSLVLVGLSGGTLTSRMRFCGKYRPEFLYVENWREDDQEAREALAAEPPFTLALHPQWFKRVQRVPQVKELLKRYRDQYPAGRHLRFLPDTAHMTIVGDRPADAISELFDDLAAVHIKDWIPTYGRYSQRYAQGFVPLGRGVVPLGEVLKLLRDRQFQGWIVAAVDFAAESGSEVAAECADWLVAHGWMERSVRPFTSSGEFRRKQEEIPRPQSSPEITAREMKFLDRAFEVASLGSARFYQAVVEALHDLGGLRLVQLYGYNPHNEELYLLGIAGQPFQSTRTVIAASTGLWRHAINEQRIYDFDLSKPENTAQFEDVQFSAVRAKQMVTVPIFSRSNPHHLRFLLNLFPLDAGFWGLQAGGSEELNRLASHVSRLAETVSDAVCSAAGMETSYACGQSKTKREFLANLVRLIRRQFDCEGASVFLVNETGDRLELIDGATVGVEWDESLKPHERYYSKGVGLTGYVWENSEMLLLSDANKRSHLMKRSWEMRESQDRNECLFFPMARLGGTVLGVIRLVNKRKTSGSPVSTMFTDDDAAILDSVVQAALPYLELLTLQERQLNALTRMTHEFQVPMVAIRAAVDFMQRALKEKSLSPKELFGEDYLDDVLNWSGIMGRLASNARIFAATPGSLSVRPSRTLLKSEVVAPAVHQVRSLLHERGFEPNCIQFGDFADIPPLWIDRHQFQQVVFNLLSNSIKYADHDRLKVRIDAGQSGSAFLMWFQDWGFGVESGLEDLIFQPGYRSREAMRRDASGQGIGLSVVRTIVSAHGGRIRLTNCRGPTTFEISLPASLRIRPPTAESKTL
jgi:signal transduction histidine kinase/sugar phosphate isomerase/epimerase